MTRFALGPKAAAAGYRLAAFDSVGSTNSEAAAAAQGDDPGKIWFTALQQTEGRGRRGRQWATPHGNLAASLLLRPQANAPVTATLGFVAGVALDKALSELLPSSSVKHGIDGADGQSGGAGARVALKWPNDVLADGAKLAGILLESANVPGSGPAITIGFGVNVVSAPADLPYPATCVRDLGSDLDAETIHTALAEHWVETFELWNHGTGMEAILDQWRRAAAGIGAEVAISTHGEVIRGVFETVDAEGQLIVRTPDGRRIPITAGDVHFGTTASTR